MEEGPLRGDGAFRVGLSMDVDPSYPTRGSMLSHVSFGDRTFSLRSGSLERAYGGLYKSPSRFSPTRLAKSVF